MELPLRTTTRCLSPKVDAVLFATGALARDILPVTMTTRLAKYVDFSAQLVTKCLHQSEIAKRDYTRQQITLQVHQHGEYWDCETGQNGGTNDTDPHL